MGITLVALLAHPEWLDRSPRRPHACCARWSRSRCAGRRPTRCSRGSSRRDTELAGVDLPAGRGACTCASGRPTATRRAGTTPTSSTRPGRQQPTSGFGGGPHVCLGMHVARAEIAGGDQRAARPAPGPPARPRRRAAEHHRHVRARPDRRARAARRGGPMTDDDRRHRTGDEHEVSSKGRDLDARAGYLWHGWPRSSMAHHDGSHESATSSTPSAPGPPTRRSCSTRRGRRAAGRRTAKWVLRVHPAPEVPALPRHRLPHAVRPAARCCTASAGEGARGALVRGGPIGLGQPFFVMERVRGRVPVSMPVYNARAGSPRRRRPSAGSCGRRAFDELIAHPRRSRRQARRSSTSPPLGGRWARRSSSAYWSGRSRGRPAAPPDILCVMAEWLRADRPADHDDGLAWGDARIGNMMFGDDYRLLGVMDWEQASLAARCATSAGGSSSTTTTASARASPASTASAPDKRPSTSGRSSSGSRPTDLRWYEVFAGFSV